MSTAIIERIKQEIENLDISAAPEETGVVRSVSDGIAEIEGLQDARMMEMVIFDDSEGKSLEKVIASDTALYGLILNLEESVVKVVVLGDTRRFTLMSS